MNWNQIISIFRTEIILILCHHSLIRLYYQCNKIDKEILYSKLSTGDNQIKAGQTIPSSILSLNRIIQLHAEVLHTDICKSNPTPDVKVRMQQISKLRVVHLPTMLTPFPKMGIPIRGCSLSGTAALPERLCFQRQMKISLLKNIYFNISISDSTTWLRCFIVCLIST